MNKKVFLKVLLPIATVALIGGGIAGALLLTKSCNPINTDPIQISTKQKQGTVFNQLDITCDFTFYKFSSTNLQLCGDDAEYFDGFNISYEDKSFTVDLPDDVSGNRDYILQVEDVNTGIISNPIAIEINPIPLVNVKVGYQMRYREIKFNTSLTTEYMLNNIFIETGWAYAFANSEGNSGFGFASTQLSFHECILFEIPGVFTGRILQEAAWTTWDGKPYIDFGNIDLIIGQINNQTFNAPSQDQLNLLQQLAIIY